MKKNLFFPLPGTAVRVLSSGRLETDCPEIIGAIGIVKTAVPGVLLVSFNKNYYRSIMKSGKTNMKEKIPKHGNCDFVLFVSEVELSDMVPEVKIRGKLLNRKELCERFDGISSCTLTYWMKAKNFPKPCTRKIPRMWDSNEVEQWEKDVGWF